mgnify:CR=1 FL=1
MNSIIGPLIISTIAGLSTMIGSLVILFHLKEKHYNKFITLCLSFSIAIMIGISILDLIPESFISCHHAYGLTKTIILLCISFIVSILIISMISKFMDKEGIKEDLYKLGILNMFVLILHNLPEGIATFLSSYQDLNLGIKLGFAIMLHNIPEGISIAVPIYYATKSKFKAFKATFISGVAEPLGAILAFIFLKNYVSEIMISVVLIVVAGLMISLSIQELLPKALKYKENKLLYIGLGSGVVIVIINMLLF